MPATVSEIVEAHRSGAAKPEDTVLESIRRIRACGDPAIFISVADEAMAIAQAREAARNPSLPLCGVPVAVKDNIDAAGFATTAACPAFSYTPKQDATAVAKLKAAGAIVVGKTNLDQFATGLVGTRSPYGAPANAFDPRYVSGGSSSGSGVAVAAGLASFALGTDTAGSVRIPAAYCGVTGLRPTTGRVSNHGVVPVSFTLDTVGPLAPSAHDCALVLDAIAGLDPLDASTVDEPVPSYAAALEEGVDGLRVGLVTPLVDRADPAIAEAVRTAVAILADAGAEVEETETPLLDEAGTILQLIMLPEASEVHLPWMRTRLEEYGADVRIRLLTGMMLPATSTATARRARRWYCDALGEVLDRYDLLVAPQMLAQPPRIGEDTVTVGGEEVLYRLSVIPTNSPWTLAGLPVASVPCGFAEGLPVGLAVIGSRFAEATVLRAAHAYQRVTDWHERRPPQAG